MGDITVHMEVNRDNYPGWRNSGDKYKLKNLAIFFIVLQNTAVSAANWEFQPSLAMLESYDDNIWLVTKDKDQDYITEVNPGISIHGKGNRSELNIDYLMQNIFYKKNNIHNETYHVVSADLKTEFLKNILYLDVTANHEQREFDETGVISIDKRSIRSKRTDLTTYSISPYLIHNFGSLAELRIQYVQSVIDYKVDYNDDPLYQPDAIIEKKSINLKNGKSFNNVGWELHHEKKEIDIDSDTSDVSREDSYLSLKFFFSSKSYMTLVGGYETNEYEVPTEADPPNGRYWSSGFGWQATRRTKFEISTGERFYGKSLYFNFSHSTRKSVWDINYTENILTTSELALRSGIGANYDESGEIGSIDAPVLPSQPQVFINKLLVATVAYQTQKSTVNLMLRKGTREYQQSGKMEITRSASLRWRYRILPKTHILLSASKLNKAFAEVNREDDLRLSTLRIEQMVSKRLKIDLTYQKTEQDSTTDEANYDRNLYTLGVRMTF